MSLLLEFVKEREGMMIFIVYTEKEELENFKYHSSDNSLLIYGRGDYRKENIPIVTAERNNTSAEYSKQHQSTTQSSSRRVLLIQHKSTTQ